MQHEPSQLTGSLPELPHVAPPQVFGERTYAREHYKTAGEKKFDSVNYTGLGYVVNVLSSVFAVYWVERTHSGQQWMKNFVERTTRALPKVNAEFAQMIATKTFFLSGGFAVLAPMKLMEDHKVQLVKKWNRAIYGDKVNTDPLLVQSEKELEQAPTQGWASIMASRMLALVPFYVGYGLLWDHNSQLAKATNRQLYIDRPIVKVSRWIGEQSARLSGNKEAAATLQTLGKESPGIMHSARSAGLHDPNYSAIPYYFISEAITSGMVAWGVYALSRMLAPVMGKKHNTPKAPTPSQHHAAPTVTKEPVPTDKEATEVAHSSDVPDTKVVAEEAVYHNRQHTAPEPVAKAMS